MQKGILFSLVTAQILILLNIVELLHKGQLYISCLTNHWLLGDLIRK